MDRLTGIRFSCIVTVQGDDYDEAEAEADAATRAVVGDDPSWPGLYRGCREWTNGLFAHLVRFDQGEPVEDDVFGTGQLMHMFSGDTAEFRQDGTLINERDRDDADVRCVMSWDSGLRIASLYRLSLAMDL